MNKNAQSALGEDGLITLTSKDVAALTGGDWERLAHPVGFPGVSVGEAEVAAGEIYFPLSREQWGVKALAALEAAQAGGVVVPRDAPLAETTLPVLRVDDPRDALRLMAEENRRRAKAKRILVTGTEGKTGFKIMLHHIMSRQIPCHAVLNSSNLHVPIWRSLASIRREDEYEIVEISVAQPNRGWQRSQIVRPHYCVFTNISSQHTALHGSLDRLIRNKAEAVTGLEPGGVCFINADNDYFLDLKDAIQRIKRVPVISFGSHPDCEGRLLASTFVPRKGGWQVQARIFGNSVNYFVRMVNSYAPLASVSALTVAAYLELDMVQACASLADFQPFETAGRIVTLPIGDGEFTLVDHSLRGSVAGFRSAFDDLQRIAGGHKVRLVLGAIRDLAEHEKEPIHRELASFIVPEQAEKLYTVGDEMKIVREALGDKTILGPHGDTYEEIMQPLFDDIRSGDVVFVKGHHRVWLSLLVEAMEARFRRGSGAMVGQGAVGNGQSGDSPCEAAKPAIRLVAGGDVLLCRNIPGILASAGIDSAFRDVQPLLDKADIALVNLECVLSGCGEFFDKGESRPYYYRAPPAMAEVLVKSGITAVTVANNHAMDFGPEALAEQAGILAQTGIACAGSGADAEQAMQASYLRVGQYVVALLSFATDQEPLAAGESRWGIFQTELDRDAVRRVQPAIEAARECADVVIVSPHWGLNWKEAPSEEVRRLAWALIDLGADAVLGHSAHILQGVEVYRGKPIVYDMGTLLFDFVNESRMRHSALFELMIGERGIERLIVHPVELERAKVRPATAEESANTLSLIETLSRNLDHAVEFRRHDKMLELNLAPQGLIARRRDPEVTFEKNAILSLPASITAANVHNIFYDTLPAGLDADRYVDLGNGLKVFGARFVEQGRAGCGFALEVYFVCPQPEGRRWRATLLGIDPKTGGEFRYRHPVSEGMWVSQNWQGERIIVDRIAVRPPANLAPANYDLYWNLVDADTGNLRTTLNEHPRVKDSWLYLGSMALTKDVPYHVAGLADLDSLPMRLFDEPSASETPRELPEPATPPSQPPDPQEGALAGLRRFTLDDLPHYKAVLTEAKRTAWQHYFPFLYLYSLTAKTEEFLISEDQGSLCIYRHNRTATGSRLYLAFLPMPMNMEVLKRCLERIRSHNQSREAIIHRIDEEDLGVLRELVGAEVSLLDEDFLYSPMALKSLAGGKAKTLRNNLSRVQALEHVEVRPYLPGDLADCLAIMDDWAEQQKDKYDKILYQRYTRDCLKFAGQFEQRDLSGRVVLVGGKIRAFGFSGEMRPGLANLFVAYSDHRVKGLQYFLKYRIIMDSEGVDVFNDGRADSPGLKYSKESMCPVGVHNVYRAKIST